MSSSKHENPRNIMCERSAFCGGVFFANNFAKGVDGPLWFYKQHTMWINPCHFATKGCSEGNNCRFAHCNRQIEIAERLLRTWGHEFPHEAGALIKVYREAFRVVNNINPNPQKLNIPIRSKPDEVAEHESVSSAGNNRFRLGYPVHFQRRFRPFSH